MTQTSDRDEVVARALAEVRVPAPDPDFWPELEARLAGGSEVAPIVETGENRRPRAWAFLLVAAAVAVVVGSAFVVSGDRQQRVDMTPAESPPSTSPPPDPLPTTTVAGDAGGKRGASSPEDAVAEFIRAVGEGRLAAAAALVGPRTERSVTALGGNVEGMLYESESYGAWTETDYSTTEVELGTVEGVESVVVVVSGDWRGEGADGFRADAIPVSRSGAGGTWLVEFMAFDQAGGRLEILEPAHGESGLSGTTPDGVMRARAEGRGDGTFWFSLEDGSPVKVAGTRKGGGVEATWDPPGEMASQTHLLVVAYIDGHSFTAFAGTFAVEG